MWQVLTHERNRATLHEIESHWTLDDLLDAHQALGVWDELAYKQAEESERRARK